MFFGSRVRQAGAGGKRPSPRFSHDRAPRAALPRFPGTEYAAKMPGPGSWSRETRLLLVTIVVSAAVLAVLAQFRFPDTPRVEPPAQPLERLAARATYDELAGIIERLDRRIAPSLVVLRAGSRATPAPRALGDLLNGPDALAPRSGFVPSLRVRPDVAIAMLPPGASVQGVLGDPQAVPLVLATDPVRRLALVRVPPAADAASWQWQSVAPPDAPRYVAVVEGTRGGSTLRPVFLGKADRFEDPRWETPLIVLGHEGLAREGAFVFSLEGGLIGLTVNDGGVLAVVPGPSLTRSAEQLLNLGTPTPNDAGLVVQPLTGPLASAVGSMTGVLVVDVTPGSPADGAVIAGDLIETVDDAPAGTPETLLLRIARSAPGATLRLGIRRNGSRVDVALALAGAGSMRALPPWPGFTTEAGPGGTRVTAVEPGSPAAAAGLRVGDVITFFAGRPQPTPRDLGPLVAGIEEGRRALVIIARDGQPHALAIERPR